VKNGAKREGKTEGGMREERRGKGQDRGRLEMTEKEGEKGGG
jgi:hypothetical protein